MIIHCNIEGAVCKLHEVTEQTLIYVVDENQEQDRFQDGPLWRSRNNLFPVWIPSTNYYPLFPVA